MRWQKEIGFNVFQSTGKYLQFDNTASDANKHFFNDAFVKFKKNEIALRFCAQYRHGKSEEYSPWPDEPNYADLYKSSYQSKTVWLGIEQRFGSGVVVPYIGFEAIFRLANSSWSSYQIYDNVERFDFTWNFQTKSTGAGPLAGISITAFKHFKIGAEMSAILLHSNTSNTMIDSKSVKKNSGNFKNNKFYFNPIRMMYVSYVFY